MIGILADAIVGSTTALMATCRALSPLALQWRARRRIRARSSAMMALSAPPQYPAARIERLVERLHVSFPASRAITQLCEIGVLEERAGYERNRIFVASNALSIMNRPFGAEPVPPA